MEGDYGYANARIRAMKSRLLAPHLYEALLAATGVDAVIAVLADTAYKAEIEAALVKSSGVTCVTEALRRNVEQTIGRLKRFFSGRPRELLALLLARWDIFNLMTILRAQARHVAIEDILDAVLPVGELTALEWRELAQQPSPRASLDLMRTWRLPYARALASAMAHGERAELWQLETRLLQWRYAEALAHLGAAANELMVKAMLQAEIDVVNILTLLRLCRLPDAAAQLQRRYGSVTVTPLLIPGGTLPGWRFEELAAALDVESAVRGLHGTPYAAVLLPHLRSYRESGDVTVLQRALEEWLVRTGVGMWRRDPLSIGVAIGYIWAKTNEVSNVRLIAHGKALGWSRQTIEQNLIRL